MDLRWRIVEAPSTRRSMAIRGLTFRTTAICTTAPFWHWLALFPRPTLSITTTSGGEDGNTSGHMQDVGDDVCALRADSLLPGERSPGCEWRSCERSG